MTDLITKMSEFSSELDKVNEMDSESIQKAKEIVSIIQQKLSNLRKGIDDAVSLLPIKDLKGQNFFIPKYQRGYRWEKRQVEELLNDLCEFFEDGELRDCFYCLQPVVVCRDDENERFEVVDGQQRLTTLYILLQVLGESDFYKIHYETREKSQEFLLNINKKDVKSEEVRKNPDYYYMAHARKTISEWKKGRDEKWCKAFVENVLGRVRVIWYRADGEDAIAVFTRLNIGKIRLTGAELIKALLLGGGYSKPNIGAEAEKACREIAIKWDMIESRLQDDAFWMFINDGDAYPNTRIDFLFDLLVDLNALNLLEKEFSRIGKDDIRNFRYLNIAFERLDTPVKLYEEIRKTWNFILRYFDALEEWYSDLKLYHYIGFLSVEYKSEKRIKLFHELLKRWTEPSIDKKLFVKELESRIDALLGIRDGKSAIDFDKVYDMVGADGKEYPKTQCRPILLFHNIMTIIKQNEESERSYAMSAFERFPFHLYRKEKGWDVEHIASNTDNQLTEYDDQRAWLVGNMLLVASDKNLIDKINAFIEGGAKKVKDGDFDNLKTSICEKVNVGKISNDLLNEDEKNRLWNFALLDSGTNRSYGNALFPSKRNFIIARTKGLRKVWSTENKKWVDRHLPGAFVPICTRNVFLKTYTPDSDIRFLEWDKRDAECYRSDIEMVFKYYCDSKVKEVK